MSDTDCIVIKVADEHGTKAVFGFDEASTRNGDCAISPVPGHEAA